MSAITLYILAAIGMFLCMPLCYLGPGLGGGVLAIIFGFILSLFLALTAIVWYPLKRLFKKKKQQAAKREDDKKEQKAADKI